LLLALVYVAFIAMISFMPETTNQSKFNNAINNLGDIKELI